MTTKARIGIIGAGYWAAYFYLPYIVASPDAVCVGVVRRNEAAREALKRTYEMEVATGEIDVLLDAGCDAVIVASPHSRHLEHVERALDAGCDVLVEKPMTLTTDDALLMSAAAKKSGRLVTVANGWNYSNIATWAMDLLDSGELGQVRAITGSMASALVPLYSGESGYGTMNLAGHDFEASRDTYADADAGGGYLYGQLSHQLGFALSLVGSNPQDVFATMSRLPNGTDIDDSVNVRFRDGATGSFFGSGRLPWGLRYPLTVQAFADGGTINVDFGRDIAEAFFSRPTDRETYPLQGGAQAFAGRAPDLALQTSPGDGIYNCDGPIQHLIDHCIGRPTIERASVDLGVRTVAVLDAAYRSARVHEPIVVHGL